MLERSGEREIALEVLEEVREVASLEVNGYIDVDGTSGSTRLNRSRFPMDLTRSCLVASLAVFPARDHNFPCLQLPGVFWHPHPALHRAGRVVETDPAGD